MASSPVFESDFLQQRFNERKAEARATRQAGEQQSASSDTSQRRTPGRDDNIFDDPDVLPTGRRNASNRYVSSPAGAAARHSSHNRRTSTLGTSVAGTQRTMGVREMEDHVDKLSKENFDLKMEVYHRREKTEKLEKKLEEMARLQEEHAELSDINQDLIQELDKRDRAVDEAVVMICDLEAKVRLQQEELDDVRPRTAKQTPNEGFKRSPHHIPVLTPTEQRQRTETSSDGRRRSLDRTRVSSDVSARMVELSGPRQTPRKPVKPVPSFFESRNAGTGALRSMYVEGNKQVRPIPSHTSLLSASVNEFDDERASMKSPALSFLSEIDFKSLYGKEEPVVNIPDVSLGVPDGQDRETDAASHTSSQSQRSRRARTDKWVQERGMQHRTRSPSSRQTSEKFQSLGGVLHDDTPSPERRRTKRAVKATEDSPVIPIRQNPIYGHNHFPPTPDTMLTGPSNKSSSSIIRERSMNDKAPPHIQGLSSMLHSTSDGAYFAKGTFLPKDADDFASDSDDERRRKTKTTTVTNNSFGESLYQPDGYNSDSGTAVVQASRRYRTSSYCGNKIDAAVRGHAPQAGSSSSPPHVAGTRALPARPLTVAVDDAAGIYAERPHAQRRSSIGTPTQTSFFPARPNAEPTAPAFTLTPTQHGIARPPYPDAQAARRPQVLAHRPSTPPNTKAAVNRTETAAVASAPSRADSLRQRVANFRRRNSGSQSNTSAINKYDNVSAPPSVGVNLGQRTRQLFTRRNSRSKKGSVSGTSDGRSGSAIESETEDTGTGAHASSILGTARAAIGHSPDPADRSLPQVPKSNITPTGIPVLPSADLSPPKPNTISPVHGRQPSLERSGGSSQSWRTAVSKYNAKGTPEAYFSEMNHNTRPISPTLASASAAARTRGLGDDASRVFPRRGGDATGRPGR